MDISAINSGLSAGALLKGSGPANNSYDSATTAAEAASFEAVLKDLQKKAKVTANHVVNEAAKDKQEKIALIESQLQDATQIICDIYSRFRFEDAVFKNRPGKFMNADALCELMLEAQKQSYGDGLDENCRHPYMWACKSHYYGPTFYNFPYAFGGLFARGLYAQYEKEGAAFVPTYKKLLYTTPVATAEDAAKVADIDLTDKEFWRGALQTVADKIDLFCRLVEE
jgi:oligoendopeptidase F